MSLNGSQRATALSRIPTQTPEAWHGGPGGRLVRVVVVVVEKGYQVINSQGKLEWIRVELEEA